MALAETLQYMSPEQAEGKAQRIGSHSDIFALGAILYRILVGEPPFAGSDPRTMLIAVCECDFDRQRLENADAPRELIDACLKAMSLEPTDRFASAGQIADAINSEKARPGTPQEGGFLVI